MDTSGTQTVVILATEEGRKQHTATQVWLTRASKKLESVVSLTEIDIRHVRTFGNH